MTSTQFQSEPFSNVDAAWLHMDTPTNLAVITGVLSFADPLDFTRLKITIQNRLLLFSRFRQRVVEPRGILGLPRWEVDPHFDLDYHLQRLRLPDPGDHETLQRFVSDLMSVPLDQSRPLWQFYYVENYTQGCALVTRLHHCIADGIALMQILLSLADESPDEAMFEVQEDFEVEISPLARLFIPGIRAARLAVRVVKRTGALIHEGMDVLIHPANLMEVIHLSTRSSKALGKLLFILPDQKTIFKGKCGIPKRAVWSIAIQMNEVKAISQRMGGTINDILLSAITGALRRYLEGRGEPVDGLDIRTLVPVNLRPKGELDQLGNRFGLVFLSLPIGIRDPVKRLMMLKRRMDAIKTSREAVVAISILGFIGMTPVQIERIITTIFGMKGTAVMTNVPGPNKPLYLAGQPIRSMMFWVPTPANLSLGVSILSYAGNVILGVATDVEMVPDPEKILDAFQEEFADLSRWGRPPHRVGAAVRIEKIDLAQDESHEVAITCQALTKTGKPCKNPALPGFTTCYVHRGQ